MRYQNFSDQLTEIAPLLGWRLTDKAIQSLWKRLPGSLDDGCMMDAINDAMESQARVPAMLMEFYKQRRRLKLQAPVANAPRLVAATRDGAPAAEFVKLCRTMRERKEGKLPDFCAACQHGTPCQRELDPYNPPAFGNLPRCLCLDEWTDRPLTEKDWDEGRKVPPAEAISAAMNLTSPPSPDPKEQDVVWLPEGAL